MLVLQLLQVNFALLQFVRFHFAFRFQLLQLALALGFLILNLHNGALQILDAGIRHRYFLFRFKLVALNGLVLPAQCVNAAAFFIKHPALVFHRMLQFLQFAFQFFQLYFIFIYLQIGKLNTFVKPLQLAAGFL